MTAPGNSIPLRVIRVFVLNDHFMFVQVLARFLGDYRDLLVVGTSIRGPAAYSQIGDLRPDVVVVDPGPRLSDIEPTVTRVRQAAPRAAIIALAQSFDEQYGHIARQAGVTSFVEKMEAAEVLVAIIRSAGFQGMVPGPQAPLADGAQPG